MTGLADAAPALPCSGLTASRRSSAVGDRLLGAYAVTLDSQWKKSEISIEIDMAGYRPPRHLLTQLGVTLADLQDGPDDQPAVPTMAEYLPQVVAAAGPARYRIYGSYWKRGHSGAEHRCPLSAASSTSLDSSMRRTSPHQ
jgi:hypothetical protein